MKEITVSKQEFESYEKVRASGRTNMMDVEIVKIYSGLPKEKIFYIMKNYTKFKEIFR